MDRHPLQETCLGVIVGTPILATIVVVFRVLARRQLNLRLGWDDWTIAAASFLSLALIIPSWKHVRMWHIGWHVWEIDPRNAEPNFDEYYAVLLSFQLLNIPILPLAKVSMLLLLLRGGGVIIWLRRTLYAILVFTIGSSLIPWLIYAFICRPRTGNTWDPETFGNMRCITRPQMGELLLWVTCANLITDILILPIPFIIVRRLVNTQFRSKAAVLAAFLCGLAVTAISSAKIYLQYRDRIWGAVSPDWTFNINYCISHIENNVAIILANIPILRGSVTRWIVDARGHGNLKQDVRRSHQLKTWTSEEFRSPAKLPEKECVLEKVLLCKRSYIDEEHDLIGARDMSRPVSVLESYEARKATRVQIPAVHRQGEPGAFIATYYRVKGENTPLR
ncbi:hypothetical protein ACN47E_010062 [Coniothyrium glycines]